MDVEEVVGEVITHFCCAEVVNVRQGWNWGL